MNHFIFYVSNYCMVIVIIILFHLSSYMSYKSVYYYIYVVGDQGVKDTMSKSRFRRLAEYLHLNDNTTQGPVGYPEYDW